MIMLLAAAALTLGACASKGPKGETPAGATGGANAGAEGAGANNPNAAGAGGADDEIAGPQAGLLATRVIYFDFDSAEIKGQGTDVVAVHAKYLASHSSARVRLEGHTDGRPIAGCGGVGVGDGIGSCGIRRGRSGHRIVLVDRRLL